MKTKEHADYCVARVTKAKGESPPEALGLGSHTSGLKRRKDTSPS